MLLGILNAAAGQKKDPEAREDQLPAMNGVHEAHLLFEGSKDSIPYHSVSDFLYNTPGKLSRSVCLPFMTVFWSSGYGNNDSQGTQTLSSASIIEDENEAIKRRIKTALQHFPVFLDHLLVQFWAPVSGGTQTFLSTSDLPFGLNNLPQKGPFWYRKHCMQYKYIIDDGNGTNYENEIGPPGRVFSSGVPEFNPFVGNYSIKEYPLRDLALQYGAIAYLALPVFESHGKRCVGVLEFLIFFYRGSHCWTKYAEELSQAIEAVGLKLPDISSPFLKHDVAQQAFKEIEAGLKEVCEAHNLPLAQMWMVRGIVHHDMVFSIRKKLSYRQNAKYSSFVEACGKSCLRKEEGVVGKAVSSLTSCFCKDITQLSTNEYSFALDARKAELTSCFAICLRSFDTGYLNYIVEFFLPTSETCKEPQAFLDSLVATIKYHFPSFKIASGLQLGEELSVEVIRLPKDDELGSFKICQTTKSPPRLSCSANEGQTIQLHYSCQQLALGVDAITNDRHTVCPEQSIAALPPDQEFPPNEGDMMQVDPIYQGLSLDVNAVYGGGKNVYGSKQNDTVVDAAKLHDVNQSTFKRICRKNKIPKLPSCKREVKHSLSIAAANKHIAENSFGDRPDSVLTVDKGNASNANPIQQSTTMQNESSMIINARYGADMIKFELSLLSTMMELVDEVAKRFGLQAGTYKAKYKDEDDDMILLACDEDLQKCLSTMRSLGWPIVHIFIEPK